MGIAPEKIVSLPAAEDPNHTLLSAALNPGGDGRPDGWQMGLTAKAEFCGEASAWDPCGSGDGRAKSTPGANPETFDYHPFVLEVPIQCSSAGWEAADYEGKALRFIQAATAKALEREFWTGEKVPSNMSLQGGTPNDDDHVLNPGGWVAPEAVSPAAALILLSSALANCGVGAKGMIHAPSSVAEVWYQSYSLDNDGDGNLVTGARGDTVVVGSGYTGQGPYGQPDPLPGQVWVFATGPVAVLLDDAEVFPKSLAEALDRQTNTVVFRGERTAAAFHNGCCSFAVLVDTTASNIPLQQCVGPEPIPRSYDIEAGWTDFEGLGPTLLLGIPGGITPPPVSVSAQLSFAPPRGPIDGTPTSSDLPSSWENPGIPPLSDPTVTLPLAMVGPFIGNPVWLRFVVTDDRGCYTTAYAYFPIGLNATWDDPLNFYLAVSDLSFTLVTVPPGPAQDPIDWTTILAVIDEVGVCPPQPFSVPVSQACGEVWDVQGTFDLGVEPVDCDGTPSLPVSLTCPDPLPVAVQEAPSVALVATPAGVTCSPGTNGSVNIPAGARVVTAGIYPDSVGDPTWNTLGALQGTPIVQGQTVVLQAPPGFTLPELVLFLQVDSREGNNRTLSYTAYS